MTHKAYLMRDKISPIFFVWASFLHRLPGRRKQIHRR